MKEKITPVFKHIFFKELKSYFISPIAYIVISIFLLVVGALFFNTVFLFRQASLTRFFAMLPTAFTFIVPALTMRLFSEEVNIGTYELLLTLPITFRDIILGKFLAAVAFIGVMLSPTLLYGVTLSFLSEGMDWGPIIGGYIGAILLAAAFCAIGLLASALTRNQVVAFIIGVFICFMLTIMLDFLIFFLPQSVVDLFNHFSANHHFQNIAKGVIDSRNILYFLSVCFVFLYGANLIMQEKK